MNNATPSWRKKIISLPRKMQVDGKILATQNQRMDPALLRSHNLPRPLTSGTIYSTLTRQRRCTERNRAKTVAELADTLRIPHLSHLVHSFLHTKIHSDDDRPCSTCPHFLGRISIFNLASSTFYALSDLCGTGGMRREYIRACTNWRNEGPR